MAVYVDSFRNVDGVIALQFDGQGQPWGIPVTVVREHGRCIVNVEVADAYRESTEIGVDVAGECLTIRVNGSRADAATARRLASEWATVPVSPPLGDGEALDLDGITASYDHGTLRIGIPVVRRPVPRRIAVTTDSSLHADAVTPVSFNAVAPSSLRR